jgi:hypothetical protein
VRRAPTRASGRRPKKTDCLVEFDGVAPATGRAKRLTCEGRRSGLRHGRGGERELPVPRASCFNVADPALPQCTPQDVATFELANPTPGKKGYDPQLAALAAGRHRVADRGWPSARSAVPLYVPLAGKKRFKADHQEDPLHRALERGTEGRRQAGASPARHRRSCPRPDAAYAEALVIDEPAQLIEGPLSRGRIGDVLLANDRHPGRDPAARPLDVRHRHLRRHIIDADLQRPTGEERDSFEEITQLINVENTGQLHRRHRPERRQRR